MREGRSRRGYRFSHLGKHVQPCGTCTLGKGGKRQNRDSRTRYRSYWISGIFPKRVTAAGFTSSTNPLTLPSKLTFSCVDLGQATKKSVSRFNRRLWWRCKNPEWVVPFQPLFAARACMFRTRLPFSSFINPRRRITRDQKPFVHSSRSFLEPEMHKIPVVLSDTLLNSQTCLYIGVWENVRLSVNICEPPFCVSFRDANKHRSGIYSFRERRLQPRIFEFLVYLFSTWNENEFRSVNT